MPGACEGPIEIDHVRRGGMGKRSPSRRANLASLCRGHHRLKTDQAKRWRPVLISHLQNVEPDQSGVE